MATTKQVSGQLLGADGVGRPGKVTVVLSAPATIAAGGEVSTTPIKTLCNDSGIWSVNLYSNADLTPAATTYAVTEQAADGSAQINLRIIVPNTAGPFQAASIQG